MRKKVTAVKNDISDFLQFGMVAVHLDSSQKGVSVPDQFLGQQHLLLNFSYRYANADLTLDKTALKETLTFGGIRFPCVIPYRAIYLIQSPATGKTAYYPENMPEEMFQSIQQQTKGKAAPEKGLRIVPDRDAKENIKENNQQVASKPAAKCTPKLRLVDGDKEYI